MKTAGFENILITAINLVQWKDWSCFRKVNTHTSMRVEQGILTLRKPVTDREPTQKNTRESMIRNWEKGLYDI